MRFNRNARLDTSGVDDRRGMGMPAIGGGMGVIGLVLALLFGGNVFDSGGGDGSAAPVSGGEVGQCQTGADANQSGDCRMVAVFNSLEGYWHQYETPRLELFSQSVSTACGPATSAVGPFYCPGDQRIYLDLGFFQELQSKFGARGGPFAEAYVVAHEYGHHVQNATGQINKGDSVRTELQADCYAGVWAAAAEGDGLIEDITDDDIAIGLDAAASVGDDRIQERFQGEVNPDTWTHGSAAQRQQAFTTGYRGADPGVCA
jgi:predicted metalloprotease